MQAKPLQIHTRSTQAPAVRHGARVNACCPPFTHPRLHVSHAEPLGPHSNQPAASDRAARLCCNVASKDLKSDAELFIESVVQESQRAQQDAAPANGLQASLEQLQQRVAAGRSKVVQLQAAIDDLYQQHFTGAAVSIGPEDEPETIVLDSVSEQSFGELGRARPEVMRAVLALQEQDAAAWGSFQSDVRRLKLQRSRAEQELREVSDLATAAERQLAKQQLQAVSSSSSSGDAEPQVRYTGSGKMRVVLVSGFESFNVELYKQAAQQLARQAPHIKLQVFSDRDIESQRAAVEEALATADVFFGSLLFDYDQVEWLRARLERVPVRLVFESSLELMSSTSVGSFTMGAPGEKRGPPPAVKKVLSLFGSGREEDKMVGYLSFLKVGPQLLKFVPGDKARDLRSWLTVYSYWNQGGLQNVVQMFLYLSEQYFKSTGAQLAAPQETPATGCLHPNHNGYFNSPAEYMKWYEREGPLRGTGAPVVAVLLYRKHVITDQQYIPQLIRQMEGEGLIPLPIFINGVEAHTVVRDQLSSRHEQALIRRGEAGSSSSLKRDAVVVDAVVNTIGFPLVGGPAGTMEGGRQSEVAKAILTAKNIPYLVAAPLLIQDLASWSRDGIAGLQSVVLYSLPELDGAIDTVPLGGLVGNDIFLIPERVQRMAARLRKWIDLRRKPPQERKVAVLLYGFPPGVGATGTAALLNVPKSLEALLHALGSEGYDLGPAFDPASLSGEALVTALKAQEDQRVISRGIKGVQAEGAGDAAAAGFAPGGAEVTPAQLKQWLSFPEEWGPSEWGPMPFLPEPDVLVRRLEAQWGELRSYTGLSSTAAHNLLVPGLQAGNVFVGVQPLLGVEGDPMRLLFERDLTPHPQYAAFYKWLQNEYQADVVLHFGMHGTVEWLPGTPLGNTGLSWSDVLLGDLPNVYVYACNNPSESIVAKRRGYGTIISHNVPPYGRAGLYKQLAAVKDLVAEYREGGAEAGEALKGPIIEALNLAGLQQDCPYTGNEGEVVPLTAETAEAVPSCSFSAYVGRLWQYLQVLENRLFSEGLHVLGQPPSEGQMGQYLAAYFGEDLPEEALAAVVQPGAGGLEEVRARLERSYMLQSGDGGGPAASSSSYSSKLEEAVRIRDLLARNTEELAGVLKALRGEYVEPEAGGDLLRDGAGVLPTGRNIHALDPYRMPSPAAMERGAAAANAILDAHRAANDGAWPETVAVNLWGLDAIKTKGESVAIALTLVGARPVKEGTGRVARFELVPLEELGRPRVDVLCNMSGIFRDSFQNVVELLDDLFQRAAAAEEPLEMNYVRKHAGAMEQQGLTNTAARLFSNPAGDYGSMVNERIGAGNWDNGAELGDTWAARNSFSYGRGGERGTARPEVLQGLLATCDRVVQEIDSVEYGLTDIQEYYANTGALKKAAESARGGRKVGCSIVETFSKEVQPRELEEVLRLEYRSKLLNPRWAQAMAAQGSGGAFEISQRMTAMVGWGATTEFKEDWAWDQAAETYALDPEMAATLRKNNPQAFSNMLKRMLEAAGRGMWQADAQTLQQLRNMYAEMDDVLEGVAR